MTDDNNNNRVRRMYDNETIRETTGILRKEIINNKLSDKENNIEDYFEY